MRPHEQAHRAHDDEERREEHEFLGDERGVVHLRLALALALARAAHEAGEGPPGACDLLHRAAPDLGLDESGRAAVDPAHVRGHVKIDLGARARGGPLEDEHQVRHECGAVGHLWRADVDAEAQDVRRAHLQGLLHKHPVLRHQRAPGHGVGNVPLQNRGSEGDNLTLLDPPGRDLHVLEVELVVEGLVERREEAAAGGRLQGRAGAGEVVLAADHGRLEAREPNEDLLVGALKRQRRGELPALLLGHAARIGRLVDLRAEQLAVRLGEPERHAQVAVLVLQGVARRLHGERQPRRRDALGKHPHRAHHGWRAHEKLAATGVGRRR
mmetsp:Transcript_37423/g.116975  ORF Transcript_37423/g.116975 Transcript_37423/m.116975 type:complete len:326 (-) Transcript_37423:156-1133(-)